MTPSNNSACLVLGGGQHAKVVIDAMQAAGLSPYGILDPDPSRWCSNVLGVPILGGDDLLNDLRSINVRHFVVGVGSTRDTQLRRMLFEAALGCGMTPTTVRHPTSIVASSATIEDGAQMLAGAIVNSSTIVRANVIVNTGAIVEHDCCIGPHAHLSPGVRLGGSVMVGEGAHVGIGATVLQNIRIGARATIGAGAVVIDHVPADTLVVGVPAREPKRNAA